METADPTNPCIKKVPLHGHHLCGHPGVSVLRLGDRPEHRWAGGRQNVPGTDLEGQPGLGRAHDETRRLPQVATTGGVRAQRLRLGWGVQKPHHVRHHFLGDECALGDRSSTRCQNAGIYGSGCMVRDDCEGSSTRFAVVLAFLACRPQSVPNSSMRHSWTWLCELA